MPNERRSNDRDIADHEIRLIEHGGQIRRLIWHHENDNVINRLFELEKHNGVKKNGSAFTDEQTKRIKEHLAEAATAFLGSDAFNGRVDFRIKSDKGDTAVRIVLWACGAAFTVSTGILLAYIKFKG